MAQNKVVVGTIVKKSYTNSLINAITIKSELGTITIERGKNWDGGIYWEGKWCQGLKVGDQVDLIQDGKRYGFYQLGSLLDSPARKEEEQRKIKKIMNFINQPRQDAVVKDYWYFDHNERTHVKCWNPVWKEIEFESYNHIPLRYNDVISLEKDGDSGYRFIENKTLKEETNNVINNVLLRDFDEAERKQLYLTAWQLRTHEK